MAVSLEQTGDLLRRSQTLMNQAVDRGTTVLADRVEHYTNVARDVGEVLRQRGEPQAADVVEMLAGRVHDAAQYLRTHDGNGLWTDIQAAARGKGWILAGMGLVSGLAAARAIRTAADGGWEGRDYVDSYAQPQSGAASNYERA